ncbi:DUF2892 domain-containing protein [Sphingobacterium sp. E70]|uniref:YgaP family membrane protein n=1 Tax=Sphingobacterium sp. E70 TaxID=2853439 RepID=UPI00211B7D9C|nr:DUF2892 domain-containing protein [Sphingobacterium sp. E70]ULT25453.1 DUF2892 domain-containing protein [Sphingobacterium sp. E70]
MSNLLLFAFDKIKAKIKDDCIEENIGASERVLSVIAGLYFRFGRKKIFKSPLAGLSGLTLGGTLIYRGVTGHCDVKKLLEDKDVKKLR